MGGNLRLKYRYCIGSGTIGWGTTLCCSLRCRSNMQSHYTCVTRGLLLTFPSSINWNLVTHCWLKVRKKWSLSCWQKPSRLMSKLINNLRWSKHQLFHHQPCSIWVSWDWTAGREAPHQIERWELNKPSHCLIGLTLSLSVPHWKSFSVTILGMKELLHRGHWPVWSPYAPVLHLSHKSNQADIFTLTFLVEAYLDKAIQSAAPQQTPLRAWEWMDRLKKKKNFPAVRQKVKALFKCSSATRWPAATKGSTAEASQWLANRPEPKVSPPSLAALSFPEHSFKSDGASLGSTGKDHNWLTCRGHKTLIWPLCC